MSPLLLIPLLACAPSGKLDLDTGEVGAAETGTDGVTDGVTDGTDDYRAEIAWEPCALYTGGGDLDAWCASVRVPAEWTEPDGAGIELFVKRLGDGEAGKQLWLLQGGPGVSGKGWEGFADTMAAYDQDLDIYIPDHRGVGRSSRLGCSTYEAPFSDMGQTIASWEWEGCAEQVFEELGEQLYAFNTTNAAADVGWLIQETRLGADQSTEQEVHVLGGSYGTYWGQRYLQLFPDQASGVSLLGVVHPEFSFSNYDRNFDTVGRLFLAECDADPTCAGHLGGDAASFAEDLYTRIDQGHCPALAEHDLDVESIRVFFGALLYWYWDERALIPALLHRMDRCEPRDQDVLARLAPSIQDPLGSLTDDPYNSRVLAVNIELSEMWTPDPPTPEEADAFHQGTVISLGSISGLVTLDGFWPKYTPDAYDDAFAETDTPILMMNGDLDPGSTQAQALPVGEHFSGPHQTFLAAPYGIHGWTSPTSWTSSCFFEAFYYFVQDPTEPVYDCTPDILPLAFENPALASAWLGTSTLWD